MPAATSARSTWPRGRASMLAGLAMAIVGLVGAGISTATAGPVVTAGDNRQLETSVPSPRPTPKPPSSGDDIPNVTRVENEIKAYYGDTTVGSDHVPSRTGLYAKQVGKIESRTKVYLRKHYAHHALKPAVVFDVDDTTLNTYNYEISVNFAFSAATNADYVDNARFPEVYGMPALVNWAHAKGYTIFFLTGRPESQRAGTRANLAKVGYTEPTGANRLYMRNRATPPPYLTYCEPTCTTEQYKSGTRAFIASSGYHIVADLGDQYSDLRGGHSGKVVKLPNPMYFLP